MSVAEVVWAYTARSIDALVAVLEGLDEAGRGWRPDVPEANSVATLANHTIANAEDNLLGTVCGDDVRYERQADFDTPETEPAAVRARWDALRARFDAHLPSLTDERLHETVEHPRRGPVTRLDVLVVVTRHAAEHLAHADLTRDLYDAQTGGSR
ncbi:MAG: DinB family protein [Dehalococcoidia bacterium]|nr:DinB family protein [Dehalococcoidia bacterium]